MTTSPHRMRRAAVLGAGIAGLAVAAVLAKFFGAVVLIEPDPLPLMPRPRKATPQDRHVHALLQSGRDALSRLFPGLEQCALGGGSLDLRVRSQWRTSMPRGWVEPVDTGLHVLSQTRPLLVYLLHARTLSLPGVRQVRGKACGIEFGPDGAVAAALLAAGSDVERVAADLVVDASGRADQSGRWLAAAGCPAPPTEMMYPQVRYVSALFTRSVAEGDDLAGWLSQPAAPQTKGAVLAPVEDGRWIVTASQRFAGDMPRDEGELRGFLQSLPDDRIVRLLQSEQRLSTLSSYRIDSVRFRRFDLIREHLPEGYLPIGDTLATFNPLYGQGMSVAALQAEWLGQRLASGGDDSGWRRALCEAYLPRAASIASWAWLTGQAIDLGYPCCIGDVSPAAAGLHRAMRLAFASSVGRPALQGQVDRILHLLDPPDRLHAMLAEPQHAPTLHKPTLHKEDIAWRS